MNVADALKELPPRLAAVSETARLDTQVLLAHVLGRPRAWLLAHPEAGLDAGQAAALAAALERLEAGEPLPYVLGRWEFWGLDFTVTPATLIPRPETELLVETALAWLKAHPARRRAVDVGAGTGCIAVSLAVGLPDLRVTAVDLSAAALRVARQNAARHAVIDRLHLAQADLLTPFGEAGRPPFDLICANLPYVPEAALAGLRVSRWEPRLALAGGPDGLDLIRRLLAQAGWALAPGGLALLEIEAGQGPQALRLAQAACPAAQAQVLPDLAGHPRLLRIFFPD